MESLTPNLQNINNFLAHAQSKTKKRNEKIDSLTKFFYDTQEDEISSYSKIVNNKLSEKTVSDLQKIDFLSQLKFFIEFRKKIKPTIKARLSITQDALNNPEKYTTEELDAIRAYIRFFDFPVKNSSCELIAIHNTDIIEKIKKGDIDSETIDRITDFEIQNFFILQNGWNDKQNPGFEYLLFDKKTGFTNKTIIDKKEYSRLTPEAKENLRSSIINNIFKNFKDDKCIIPDDIGIFDNIKPFYFSIIDKLYSDSLYFANKEINKISNLSNSFEEFTNLGKEIGLKSEDIKRGIQYFSEDSNQYNHNQANAVKTKIDSFTSCVATLLLIKEKEIPLKINILNQETGEIHTFEFNIDSKTKKIVFVKKYVKTENQESDKTLRNSISLEANTRTTKDLEILTKKIEEKPLESLLFSLIILYRGLTPKNEEEKTKAQNIYKESLNYNAKYEKFYDLLIHQSYLEGFLEKDKAPFYKSEIEPSLYPLTVEHMMNSSSPKGAGLKALHSCFNQVQK